MSDMINDSITDIDTIKADEVGFDAARVQGMLFQKRIKGDSQKKKFVATLLVFLILAASGYGYTKWSASSDNPDYSMVTAALATITDSVEATGSLSAIKQSAMGFKNDDTITAINVQAGDQVKAGQILAQQDPANLQAALQQAVSTVEQDQISIKSAQLTYESNRKTLERQQTLFAAGALSQSDLDTAQDDFTKSEWAVATAKSKLTIDQTKVDQAQANLDACTLVAPFDGIIGEVNGQVGQINGINSSSSTLLTIMSTDLELTALVNEADIGCIKVGQDVEFTSSSYSDKIFTGKVQRITPQATSVSNVQYYPVLISCTDPDKQLLSGMSVTVNIIVARQKNALAVPMMAVSFAQNYLKSNPTDARHNISQTGAVNNQTDNAKNSNQSSRSASVAVIKNGQLTVKSVSLGLNDGSNYEVIQGLSEGERVVVGSTQIDSQSDTSGTNSSTSTKTKQNQGSGGMGGPPPGI